MSHVIAIFAGMDSSSKFYQLRHPEDSPFFKVLEANFDSFELNFPALFQPKYGFWRPVIRKSLEKFLKCGDLREGFAIVRCKECGDEKFMAFSCKQRSCCPNCDKKRSIILGRRLTTEIIQPVAHRQWVFMIPKRLHIYHRIDRRLLGKLSRCAYETMRDRGWTPGYPDIVKDIPSDDYPKKIIHITI